MKFHKKLAVLALTSATTFGSVITALPTVVHAEETAAADTAITSVEQGDSKNIVNITFQNGNQGRVTFLEEGIFRYNIDPTGTFSKYATGSGNAKIQAQPDESSTYTHPEAAIEDGEETVTITSGDTHIVLNKADGKMTVKSGEKTVMEESAPIKMGGGKAVQSIVKHDGEDFYGGGTQNGRFVHTGEQIEIRNTNNWTDGGVASPNPFYWTTNGYGVVRNTFKPGAYNFGKTSEDLVSAEHNETEFDAYYFVTGATDKAAVAKDLLQSYFKVTGNPVLLPEYAFYLGHLNCYNRDSWDTTGSAGRWTIKNGEPSTSAGTTLYEGGRGYGYVFPEGSHAESLNGTTPTVNADKFVAADAPVEYSAREVINRYQRNDMPFGWFLPNDGYGCGYGQNGYYQEGGTAEEREASLKANLQNLGKFSEYANSHGVSTGLWTQSNLTPIASEKQHLVRDFRGEVLTGGITSLKTDVAWVGSGYSFGLNGIKTAYDIVTDEAGKRPNIVTLDGWAGTQRYGTIWTGDQYGGEWEYIRFHIPTFIGQSLAGNPNVASDMDGIFGGHPILATRDYQWKTFITSMLDMDGWGSYVKSPYTHGDPYTGISRMYLKLKAQLMPYIYTSAASAANIDTGNNDTGLPYIRAMMLVDDSEYAASKDTQYQFMFGDDFLVAPIYQDTAMEDNGNDIRNDIFLPGDENDIWIDYFTGDQYRGGQIISNFDAPLWKLPLFVRGGAIIPMYEENNNPVAISEDNPDGLDRTKRIVEFYPLGDTEYTLREDDGITVKTTTAQDEEYGLINEVDYGEGVKTTFTSSVKGETVTLKAGKSEGSYEGYDSNRNTKFVVNVSKKPTSVSINGAAGTEAASLEAFEKLGENESGWFYDEAPEMNKYAGEEEFAGTHIINQPKVYVKFAKTDVAANEQIAVLNGFENEHSAGKDVLVESLAAPVFNEVTDADKTPTSINLSWNEIEGAVSYDVMASNGMTYNTVKPSLLHSSLEFNTAYTYKVRVRTADGYSAWSEELTTTTLDDPWRNVPTPVSINWEGGLYGSHSADLAFDHVFQSGDGGFHSGGGDIGKALTVDLGKVYPLASLEYFPRTDAGNGTVTQMDIATSMDGVYWTELPTQTWERSAATKWVDLEGAGRYVRMIPRASVGNFFSASEIRISKVDGKNGWALGSNTQKPEVVEGDYSNLRNYRGVENKEPDVATFKAQIGDHYADLNANDVYDVYDYSFTMAALDGGTKKTGAPTGNLFFLADKTEVKTGDEVTVTLYGNNIKNANALGAIFRYDTRLFTVEAGENTVKGSPYLGDMENLSMVRNNYVDGTGTVNIAFANRGDKDLYNGTRAIATFKLVAKTDGLIGNADKTRDGDVILALNQNTMLIGPTGTVVDKNYDHGYDESEIPTVEDVTLAQSDLNVTITNEALTEDDGTNVETLIHQGSFDGLFDGSTGDRNFEFVWTVDGSYDSEIHKVPATIHMALKKPTFVKSFDLYAGALNANGHVEKVGAVVTYEDGSTTEFDGGAYDAASTHYAFEIPSDKRAVKVTKIDLTIKESGGNSETADPANGTLTLSEIVIKAPGATDVEGITSAESNPSRLSIGQIAEVHATVNPSSAYQFFKVSSSDENVAAVDCVRQGNDMSWFLIGKGEGTATITLTSLSDETKKATFEVEVGTFTDSTELDAAIARAQSIKNAGILLDASKPALDTAIAEALAAKETAGTQDEIDAAAMNLNKALNNLRYRDPKEEDLINKTADAGVAIVEGSSDCGPNSGADEGDGLGTFEATLDKNIDTYWHSDWANAANKGVPQWITYDLGKEYALTDVSFLPRNGRMNGDMLKVELLVGNDAENLASIGTWEFAGTGTGGFEDRGWKNMTFPTVNARYVKVNVLKSAGDSGADQYSSMAEINFYGATEAEPGDEYDTTMLGKVVEYADGLNQSSYKVGDALNAFVNALASAKEVLANAASQADIDAAASDLNGKLMDIRLVPNEDLLKNLE